MNDKSAMNEASEVDETHTLLSNVRKVVLAGVGAIASAQESAETQIGSFVKDVEAFINKLVERGEIADKEGRELISEVVEKRKAAATQATEKVSQRVDSAETVVTSRLDKVISRLNVPTQSDFDAVTQKIVTLGEKVDQLKAAQKEMVAKQAETAAEAASYKKDATSAKRKATIAEKEAKAANDHVASLQKELAAAQQETADLKKKLTKLQKAPAAKPGKSTTGTMSATQTFVEPSDMSNQVASNGVVTVSN